MFQIGGVVLLRCGCVAEERTAKGCGKFGDKFLTGVERIPEEAAERAVQPLGASRAVRHLVQKRAVIFRSLRELLTLRANDMVGRGRIVGTVRILHLDGAIPILQTDKLVQRLVNHPVRIVFGLLPLFHALVAFGLLFGKIGLVDVEDIVILHLRDDLVIFLLGCGQFAVFLVLDCLFRFLVYHELEPIIDGKRACALADAQVFLFRLVEGEEHGQSEFHKLGVEQ